MCFCPELGVFVVSTCLCHFFYHYYLALSWESLDSAGSVAQLHKVFRVDAKRLKTAVRGST